MSEVVVVIGATSGIGRALARACAADGFGVVLAGRDRASLERIAADCHVRFGVPARAEDFDALAFDDHAAFWERAGKGFGDGVDGVFLCHGEMPPEEEARRDPVVWRRMVDVNYTSAVSVLERVADDFSARGQGFICGLTSVAGDRGRASNHLYGSTKAALSTYLGGLRARLAPLGVSVVTAKPGVVDTGMTWGLEGLPLMSEPEPVAAAILKAARRDRPVVYAPSIWAIVMQVIRLIPDRIFNRLGL